VETKTSIYLPWADLYTMRLYTVGWKTFGNIWCQIYVDL